jgi:hypothetical protein
MDKILTMVVKGATLLTTLAMLALTVWSLASGQHALMSLVAISLTAVFGFFSFVDIRNMVRGK